MLLPHLYIMGRSLYGHITCQQQKSNNCLVTGKGDLACNKMESFVNCTERPELLMPLRMYQRIQLKPQFLQTTLS